MERKKRKREAGGRKKGKGLRRFNLGGRRKMIGWRTGRAGMLRRYGVLSTRGVPRGRVRRAQSQYNKSM